MKIILASASPRRRELLSRIVKDFEIIPAKGEECADYSLPPERIAERLAENMCGEVFEKNRDALVIGCDTIVVYNGVILGKPKSAEDAASTLRMLSGKTHSVITGVCVRCSNKKITSSEKT
ncbi:MAG: Maf family protein, partial [Clostridia bacterium]|nr:Maf family protein [Clostridia bacterium]